MGKRRRVTRSLDEADRKMYKTFSSAANAVSLLYTQVRPPPRPSFESFHARTREREALGLKGEYGGPAGRAVSVGSLFPAGNERGNQGLPFRARTAKNMLSDANSVFFFLFSFRGSPRLKPSRSSPTSQACRTPWRRCWSGWRRTRTSRPAQRRGRR